MNEMGVAIAAILAALGSLVTTIAMAISGGRKLSDIHVQTNSNMKAAMSRIKYLEDQIADLKDSAVKVALDRVDALEKRIDKK